MFLLEVLDFFGFVIFNFEEVKLFVMIDDVNLFWILFDVIMVNYSFLFFIWYILL